MTELMTDCYPAGDRRLLARATECWEALREFREDRERCKSFTYGDQWKDLIEENGVKIREEDFIRNQGNMPLKNNLIRRLVRNVLGVFRNQWTDPVSTPVTERERDEAPIIDKLLQRNMDANRLQELYARTMEEFLISGMAVHKKWYGKRMGRIDCWTEAVSPANFFMDSTASDFRGADLSVVGEIHDLRFDDLCASLSVSPRQREALAEHYGITADNAHLPVCRLFEVWHRTRPMVMSCHDFAYGRFYKLPADCEKAIEEENAKRRRAGMPIVKVTWLAEEQWNYSFLTPTGEVLAAGKSPYSHGQHPYVVKAYPFIDGEIHSFVGDIIDQQKLTNRLISMYDWILRASAKGVLLFPEGSLPDGVDINDIADEWSRFNGVIVYRPRPGVALPQQISSNSTDIGITQLLEIQMKMMEDISGVNGALQGRLDSNSMSGTLYNQQTRNSMTALADLLQSFDDFIRQATRIDISNIRQFCPEYKKFNFRF